MQCVLDRRRSPLAACLYSIQLPSSMLLSVGTRPHSDINKAFLTNVSHGSVLFKRGKFAFELSETLGEILVGRASFSTTSGSV